MLKKLIAVLLLVCICAPLFALDMSKAEPYEKIEFPKWTLDLRRGEIVFFGSLPLTYMFTSIGASLLRSAGAFSSDPSFWTKLGIAAGVSAGVAIADFFIGLHAR